MNEEKLQPAESLLLIESMIQQAKGKFRDNGHLYLLWGWVVLGCSVLHFLAIYFKLIAQPELIWMATWGALIYQFVYLYRNRGRKRVATYTDDILNAVWLVFVGCGLIMGFVVTPKGGWETLYPLILMLYGMPTILSGVILRFRPLVIGGFFCWVLSIAAIFLPLLYNLLLLSAAVVAAWIIPGYLMRHRYLHENSSI